MEKSDINILIVDDDNSQREVLSKAVSRRGYKAIAVARPEEAESITRIKPIHALIVDCMLPGRSGVELVADLRERVLEAAPVFLISGIYRDKGFSVEALQKTGAAEFFLKPFNIEELIGSLEKKLAALVKTPKVGLQTLLSAPLSSERERRRALDYVDGLTGYDLPFVFSILMDSKNTGHLNIVDKDSNIFGVTFNQGTILRVDSELTAEITQKTLLEKGYITAEEISEVNIPTSPDIAKVLVEKGLMSPHAKDIARNEQIIQELNQLVNEFPIKINFVQNRNLKTEPLGIDRIKFLPQLFDMVQNIIPILYLKKFYSGWNGHSIKPGPNYANHTQVSHLACLQKLPDFITRFTKEPLLEELLADARYSEENFYRGLHILAISRIIVFTETAALKDLDDYVQRMQRAYDAVKDKNPFEVFKYFGLSNNPKVHEVAQTYKEFAKSNHPDLVPQAASKEVRELNHKLFAIVTNAHDILINEERKEKFMSSLKQEEVTKQLKAEDLVAEAVSHITRGRYADAKPKIEQARKLYVTDKVRLYQQWINLKLAKEITAKIAEEANQDMNAISVEGKKTALYYFVQGLLLKALGQTVEALKAFDRSRKLDPNFADARREITALKSGIPKKMDLQEILTGDIGSVISNLFKKKGA